MERNGQHETDNTTKVLSTTPLLDEILPQVFHKMENLEKNGRDKEEHIRKLSNTIKQSEIALKRLSDLCDKQQIEIDLFMAVLAHLKNAETKEEISHILKKYDIEEVNLPSIN